MDWITSKHMQTADIEMHLGLTYANCTTGAQNKTVGDFFVCVVVGVGGWVRAGCVCVCVGWGGVGVKYTIWILCSWIAMCMFTRFSDDI